MSSFEPSNQFPLYTATRVDDEGENFMDGTLVFTFNNELPLQIRNEVIGEALSSVDRIHHEKGLPQFEIGEISEKTSGTTTTRRVQIRNPELPKK